MRAVLPEQTTAPSNRTLTRAATAALVLMGAGLVGFLVSTAATRIDVSKLQAVSPPAAPTPSPTAPPITDLARNLLPGVVTVEAERTSDEALGTGWLFDTRGDFVTNAHVVEGQLSVRITDRLDHIHVGVVVGLDINQDIAMVRASDGFHGTPLPINRKSPAAVPADVVALASSRATGQNDITSERLVQLHQDVPLQSGEIQPGTSAPTVYHDMLDVNGARVYQGNSGGPLIDRTGSVIGIITLASPTGPEAFAIPITRVLTELNRFAATTG
jgi:S1-C subfamily serine protease